MASSFTGFAELADEFEDAADALENADTEAAIDRGVESTSEEARDDAEVNAPRDTGELAESITLLAKIRALERTIVVLADHGPHVEYGTSAHIIRPQEAQALRFRSSTGETVFAAHVEHPGTTPQPYLRPALNANQRTLEREIKRELRETLRAAFASR